MWSSGGTLQALPQKRCMEIGALEACRACRDVEEEEAQRFGALEMRCNRSDIEVWRSGTLEPRCRRCLKRGMELWSFSELFVVVGISSFRSSRLLVRSGPRKALILRVRR